MCGLWGFATSKPVPRISQVLLQLAIENESRGRVSFGWSDGKRVVKSMGGVARTLYKLPLKQQGIVIGHTRAPTVGSHIAENAHPFEFKDKHHVIGAHNGSIHNYNELNSKYERTLQVDSMQIFKHIAEGRQLEELEGAGAITFFKDDELFLSRFNGGSLTIAQLEMGGIAWSSLECDLRKCLESANLKFQIMKIEEPNIYVFGKDDVLRNTKDTIRIRKISYITKNNNTNHNYGPYGGGRSNITNAYRAKSKIKEHKIRFRVVRETHPTIVDEKDPATQHRRTINSIMQAIKDDNTITVMRGGQGACHICTENTPRVLVSTNKPTCLKCAAILLDKGDIKPATELVTGD